jgi:hypothetical protein
MKADCKQGRELQPFMEDTSRKYKYTFWKWNLKSKTSWPMRRCGSGIRDLFDRYGNCRNYGPWKLTCPVGGYPKEWLKITSPYSPEIKSLG